MSQIFYEPQGRDEVLPFAQAIVIVRVLWDEQRTHALEGMPDFTYTITKYGVMDVLKGDLREGDMIEVEEADAYSNLQQHILFHKENVMESPIYFEFTPRMKDTTEFILYLNKGHFSMFKESIEGAREPVQNKEEIIKLIESSKHET